MKVTGLNLADDDAIEFLEKERDKALGQRISMIIRTTFEGKPDPKKVAKRRARNKLARKQRRINRLRDR